MSSGYVIAHVEVTNPTQYEEYKKWSTVAMQAHGAEVCVRGGQIQPLEGDWKPTRIVILKFAIGPIALDVSLLSLVGVLIAYLIARSLF